MGGIIGGIFGMEGAEEQAKAAEHAAELQADAAKIGAQTQREMFDVALDLGAPYRNRGQNALAALGYELGLGPRPEFTYAPETISPVEIENLADQPLTPGPEPGAGAAPTIETIPGGPIYGRGPNGLVYEQVRGGEESGGAVRPVSAGDRDTQFAVGGRQFPTYAAAQNYLAEITPEPEPEPEADPFQYQGFQETPGYQFKLDQGQQAINRSLAAQGRLLSGPAVKAGTQFSQGLADQTYSNYLARLASMAGLGGGFASSAAGGALATGQGVSNTLTAGAARQGNYLTQAGDARASGYAALGQGLGKGANALASFFGFGGF